MAIPNILLILAVSGFEEIETVAPIDLLRRAGANVIIAGQKLECTSARGLKIKAEKLIEEVINDDFDCVVIPGGKSAVDLLAQDANVSQILIKHIEKGRLTAAICAGPLVLKSNELLKKDCSITSHPSVKEQFVDYLYQEDLVVEFGNLITSRGAGSSIEFSLTIIERLFGKEKAEQIAKDIIFSEK